MEDVCCPANRVAISIPVISSSLRYLPPYTCTHAIGIKLMAVAVASGCIGRTMTSFASTGHMQLQSDRGLRC